jgi:hypothetical protein
MASFGALPSAKRRGGFVPHFELHHRTLASFALHCRRAQSWLRSGGRISVASFRSPAVPVSHPPSQSGFVCQPGTCVVCQERADPPRKSLKLQALRREMALFGAAASPRKATGITTLILPDLHRSYGILGGFVRSASGSLTVGSFRTPRTSVASFGRGAIHPPVFTHM